MRWYAVPDYNPKADKFSPPENRQAQIVNVYGELVAECETLRDAEHIAELHNARIKEVGHGRPRL